MTGKPSHRDTDTLEASSLDGVDDSLRGLRALPTGLAAQAGSIVEEVVVVASLKRIAVIPAGVHVLAHLTGRTEGVLGVLLDRHANLSHRYIVIRTGKVDHDFAFAVGRLRISCTLNLERGAVLVGAGALDADPVGIATGKGTAAIDGEGARATFRREGEGGWSHIKMAWRRCGIVVAGTGDEGHRR